MSNPRPTSPKPSSSSTQNSPSGWTTAQPVTKRDRPNYASPTASSAATTGRAKSRTLDSSTTKPVTPPGTAKKEEKKVVLRRNTEKSLSPTPATSQAWVSAKKGAKATTPPPTNRPRGNRSVSQDESALSARLEASPVINDMKKTGTTTEALDLLDPNMTRARSSSRMKRSVSDADLAFEAAQNIRDQIRSGNPLPQVEEEVSSEEEPQEEETQEEEPNQQEEEEDQLTPTPETQNEIQSPVQARVQILVHQAKQPEPEPVPQVQETAPQIQEAAPVQEVAPQIQERTLQEETASVQTHQAPPREEEKVSSHPEPAQLPQQPQAAQEHHEASKPEEVPQIQEAAPQIQEPIVEEPAPRVEHKEPAQPEPVVHTASKEQHQPVAHVEPPIVQEVQVAKEQPVTESLPQQQQPAEESKSLQHEQQEVAKEPSKVEEPIHEVKEVPKQELVSTSTPTVTAQTETTQQKASSESQPSESLQFSLEPEIKEQRPSSPVKNEPANSSPVTPPRHEAPKSIVEILEQQELNRRQEEESRRKALVEQEDKVRKSVQDKIQKALEERRKQVLSPQNSEDARRKSFDSTELSSSVPMVPSPISKPPSEGSLPIYISPSKQVNSILSASAPGPPSILSSSGSKRDFKRVSFNFEDGRILYPGTDGHLDIVTHERERSPERSPEKTAPVASVTAPVENSPEKPAEKPAPASPAVTVTGFTPASPNIASSQTKDEAKQAALAEKRKSINDRIQMMLHVENAPARRRSFDERDAEELKTIREQQDQRAKQAEEQEKQFHQSRAKEFEEKKRRQIEEFKKPRDGTATSLYEREAMEEQERLNKLKQNRPVNESDDPNLKGFDAELSKKMSSNIDPSWEFNACKWVEQLSGESVYDAAECLYTGIVLCKLMNAIKPNTIAKFYSKPIALMQTVGAKNGSYSPAGKYQIVFNCLPTARSCQRRFVLRKRLAQPKEHESARVVQSQADWKGPTLLNAGPAPAAVAKPVAKSVAIPIAPVRDRSKTEDLTPTGGLTSSAPEFRDRARTAGAKLSSNIPDLQHEVTTLREELETLRRQLAEKDKVIKVLKPPKWRPDEDVERCTLCALEFSFFNRRHHCRQCGEIFCGECCSKSLEIPQLNKQLQKVCNRCHIDLQQFQRNMGPTLDSWNVY